MSGAKDIFALPGELRNAMFENYIADADKTTLSFSRGKYIPPPLALASRRIRDEFLSLWDTYEPLCDGTKHIRLGVFNADHRDATAFWEKAVALVWNRGECFESVRITLVFTKDWNRTRAKESRLEYRQWLSEHGGAICPDRNEHWEVLDYRRFGRMRLLCFLISARDPPAFAHRWEDWTQVENLQAIRIGLRKWWRGEVRGARRGRWMK